MSTIKIIDSSTGEEIVRDMNDEELALWKSDKADFIAKEQLKSEKNIARQALLDRLKITEEEAQLLLGGN